MERKIYNELLKWKNNTNNIKPLMLLGVEKIGKTYIIDKFCKENYENYLYVNLFQDDNILNLYNSSLTSNEKYMQLKVLLNFDIEKKKYCFIY